MKNKQHQKNLLNGHTVGFHPQTLKLETLYRIINSITASSEWNGLVCDVIRMECLGCLTSIECLGF